MSDSLDDQIRAAFELDMHQYLVQSMTPDRGYETPIDNIKALFQKILTENEELRNQVAEREQRDFDDMVERDLRND